MFGRPRGFPRATRYCAGRSGFTLKNGNASWLASMRPGERRPTPGPWHFGRRRPTCRRASSSRTTMLICASWSQRPCARTASTCSKRPTVAACSWRWRRRSSQSPAPNLVDLLISDIRMPVCTGIQILEQIRASGWRMPVILMTAFGDDATRNGRAALGALPLDKPFGMDTLRLAAGHLLGRPTGSDL